MEVSEAGMENLIMATPRTRGGLAVVPTTWAAGADDAGLNGVGVVSSEDKSALGANGSDVWHEQELAPDHVEPRPLRPSFDEFGPEDDTPDHTRSRCARPSSVCLVTSDQLKLKKGQGRTVLWQV
jgi:hypothetical protein